MIQTLVTAPLVATQEIINTATKKVNTHPVALTGLFTALPSILTILFRGAISGYIHTHAPSIADGADTVLTCANNAAMAAVVPALLAAYAGMPKGVGETN